jgi:hypothetical protein
MAPVYDEMREADVWYVGDKRALAEYYGRAVQRERDRPSLQDRLWAAPRDLSQPERRVHVPAAGDIASASADLVLGAPPVLTVADATTQARLDAIVDGGGLHMRLLESAETTSALGDGYLALAWDRAVAPWPMVVAHAGDTAIPVFRYGRLVEVVFWRELVRDGAAVVRLLERHVAGFIEYGLFVGTSTSLGRRVPLTEHADAAPLADLVDAEGRQATGIDLLTATHIPNMRPNRRHRSYHGRSDFAAPVYDLFDSLDQVYTSWMRDVRLGRGRMVVPAGALQDLGDGKGSHFDLDREVFDEINLPPSASGERITVAQFDIRVDEHQRTAADLLTRIAQSCGYSASTFGLDESGGQMTATEVDDRRTRSTSTRARKVGYWSPAIRRIVHALLALDAAQFNSGIVPEVPTVEFPPPHTPSEETTARTLQMLAAAEAVSIDTRVRMLHPEWDDTAVAEEVARIRADQAPPVDPFRALDGIEAAEDGGPDPAAD